MTGPVRITCPSLDQWTLLKDQGSSKGQRARWACCWRGWQRMGILDRQCPAAAAAKSLQSCPTLCDPMDCSPPGFSVHGILQATVLEWVAISFSKAWKWKVKVKVKSLSRVRLLATPWTAAYKAPPSMGFSRHQYWSGVPLPSPRWQLKLLSLLCRRWCHVRKGPQLKIFK